MGWILTFLKSSIGAKVVMGLTGLVLVGWLVAHMAGNLQIYVGQETFNNYAHSLKSMTALLWTLRIGMAVVLLVHIAAGIRVSVLNRAARPQRYHGQKFQESKRHARVMALNGILIAAFLVYHLLHFTTGDIHPEYFILKDSAGRPDAYSMFVLGFQDVPIAISYIVAMLVLATHLLHGVPSFFQSLGLNTPKWTPLTQRVGLGVALLIVLGNLSMPIAVLAGVIEPVPAAAAPSAGPRAFQPFNDSMVRMR